MARKPKKNGKRRPGRPSKGPTVSVTFRLPKDLVEKIDRLRLRLKKATRTATLEAMLRQEERERRGLEEP